MRAFSTDMELLEKKYKLYDLLYSYCDKFHHDEFIARILDGKKMLAQMIIDLLKKEKYANKKCKCCGRILQWNYPYSMCKACYDEQYDSAWYRNYW